MESVGDSSWDGVVSSSKLRGVSKQRYDEVTKMLLSSFEPMQIAVMLETFIQLDMFGEFTDMSEMHDLCQKLRTFWIKKAWNEFESDEFQTLILTRPELEGVKIVFSAHPAFSDILNLSDSNNVTINAPPRKSFSIANNNNAKGKEEDSGDELVILPRRVYPSFKIRPPVLQKRMYRPYKTEIIDKEEIEFVVCDDEKMDGVIYVLNLEANEFGVMKITTAFDLIHSLYSDESVIVRILSSTSGQYENDGWVKEIYVRAHTWTNVSEKMLPCHPELFPIVFSVVSCDQEIECTTLKVKGVYLNVGEKMNNRDYITSDEFQPYDYGFCQNF